MRILVILGLLLAFVPSTHAAIQTQTVEYQDGETTLEGFLAYDDALQTRRPGVLIVHEWKGVNDHAKNSAKKLAELGYVALAVDMYGKGVRPQTNEEAAPVAGIYKNDRPLMRRRILAGWNYLKGLPTVDSEETAAIGYCFGGTTVLELARSGADIDAVVSFHGGLSTPTPEDAKKIKARVLVLHGGDDPFVKPEEVAAFKDEMKKGNVHYRFVTYKGAVHSFTNPQAGDDPSKGMAYNKEADEKSWVEMVDFLHQNLQ